MSFANQLVSKTVTRTLLAAFSSRIYHCERRLFCNKFLHPISYGQPSQLFFKNFSRRLSVSSRFLPSLSKRFYSDDAKLNSTNDHFIILRGIPFEMTEQHVVDFLKGEDVEPVNGAKGITFMLNPSGLRTSTTFVQLNSQSDVDKAKLLHHKYMGNRYVEVFRSDLANLEKDLVKAPEPIRSATGHAVHMVSIPQHTSQEDIKQFFAPLQVAKVETRLIKRPNWQTHKAFVDFHSHADAVAAVEKTRQEICGMKVTLKLVSYDGICTAYNQEEDSIVESKPDVQD